MTFYEWVIEKYRESGSDSIYTQLADRCPSFCSNSTWVNGQYRYQFAETLKSIRYASNNTTVRTARGDFEAQMGERFRIHYATISVPVDSIKEAGEHFEKSVFELWHKDASSSAVKAKQATEATQLQYKQMTEMMAPVVAAAVREALKTPEPRGLTAVNKEFTDGLQRDILKWFGHSYSRQDEWSEAIRQNTYLALTELEVQKAMNNLNYTNTEIDIEFKRRRRLSMQPETPPVPRPLTRTEYIEQRLKYLCDFQKGENDPGQIPWAVFYPKQSEAFLELEYERILTRQGHTKPTWTPDAPVVHSEAELAEYKLDLAAKYMELRTPAPETKGGVPWRDWLRSRVHEIESNYLEALQHYKLTRPIIVPVAVPPAAVANTREEEIPMPDVPAPKNSHIPTVSTLKSEMKSAAYLITADKLTKLSVVAIGSALQRGLPDESEETRAKIGKLLESEPGQVLAALLLSALIGPLGGTIAGKLGMTGEQMDKLSAALRVHGMVNGGSALLDRFLEPALAVLGEMIRDLPKELPEEQLHLHERVRDRGELEPVRDVGSGIAPDAVKIRSQS